MSGGGASRSDRPDAPLNRLGLLPRVLLGQFLAFIVVMSGAWLAAAVFGVMRPPAWGVALIQSVLAAALSTRLGLSRGWLVAQFVLPLLAWAGLLLNLPSWVFLVGFVALLLVYTNAFTERVPLYLTNRTTWLALSEWLDDHTPPSPSPAFVDLGCGLGGMLSYLAPQHPGWRFVGVETAPLPYLVSKLRTWRHANAEVRFQSLWDIDLGQFDVAYAFLSPAPMPRLIQHASDSMKPGAMLLSNSFWAPDLPYDGEIEVSDGRKSRIFFRSF